MKISQILLFSVAAVSLVGIGHHWRTRAQVAVISGGAEVLDGDTIIIDGWHIRLDGIDAPETDQFCDDAMSLPYRCGLRATAVLKEEIAGALVTCSRVGVDQYGRVVATCAVNGRDLGDVMVRRGFALDYLRYSHGRYAEAQR